MNDSVQNQVSSEVQKGFRVKIRTKRKYEIHFREFNGGFNDGLQQRESPKWFETILSKQGAYAGV